MKIFKFGGASIATIENIRNVANILQHFREERLILVVSAAGKVTNFLEDILARRLSGQGMRLIEPRLIELKKLHLNLIEGLCTPETSKKLKNGFEAQFAFFYQELEKDWGESSYAEAYDQIVSYGELFSTKIVSGYLQQSGWLNKWIDVRNWIRTDENFREANVNWEATENSVLEGIGQNPQQNFLTQGFIGSTTGGKTTTLGREGSDYTAAIIARCIKAESVEIWKDVDGVYSADPGIDKEAEKMDKLPYSDAIEMTYYGAKVIHAKTLLPLKNGGIPLIVRPFSDINKKGTLIYNFQEEVPLPEVRVCKSDQLLLVISLKKAAIMTEQPIAGIYALFSKHFIKINLCQVAATRFYACIDDDVHKNRELLSELHTQFVTNEERGLTLLTFKNYKEESIIECRAGNWRLQQVGRKTAQFLMGR